MSREDKCWTEPHVNPAALGADLRPFTFASESCLRCSEYRPTQEMELERVQQEAATILLEHRQRNTRSPHKRD